jgi:tRNA threonylcarbamoyladenosine biosynthesis protein TsaE
MCRSRNSLHGEAGLTERHLSSRTANETQAVGAELATALRGGDVILLWGDLGAGKTTLAQGIARGLGVAGPVQSPTFTLIAEYPAPMLGPEGQLVHVDLYRLDGTADLATIGLDEYFDRPASVTVIEWPDRADSGTYPPHWSVLMEIVRDDMRQITIREPSGE